MTFDYATATAFVNAVNRAEMYRYWDFRAYVRARREAKDYADQLSMVCAEHEHAVPMVCELDESGAVVQG